MHLWCKWNWEQSLWIRRYFIYTADLRNILFIQQRQGPHYHIIKVSLSTVIYCLKLKIHTNLPVCFVPVCTVLAVHWETALLLALDSAGGYSEQPFKAVPSPYVHYDNLLPTVLCSFTPLLACGNYFISASISAVINTTGKQFRGKVMPLTSFPIIKCMLNAYAATFPCLE